MIQEVMPSLKLPDAVVRRADERKMLLALTLHRHIGECHTLRQVNTFGGNLQKAAANWWVATVHSIGKSLEQKNLGLAPVK